jgi:hypothetical protein
MNYTKRQCTYKRKVKAPLCKYYCREKWIKYYIFWVCWVCVYSLKYPACEAHVHIISSSVACPYLQYFSIQVTNDIIFEKKVTEHKMCFKFSLQILSETFLILRRIRRDIIINVRGFSCKVPNILARFEWNYNFLHRFAIREVTSAKSVQRDPSYSLRSEELTHIHAEVNNHFSQFCEHS